MARWCDLRRQIVALCVAILMLGATGAWAANSVIVDTRQFSAGQTSCTVGVYITNDVPIVAMTIPLEIRTTNGGAFIEGGVTSPPFLWFAPAGNRLGSSPLGVDQGATVINRRYAVPDVSNPCTGPVSSSFLTEAANPDGVSPDAVMYAAITAEQPMAPGSDPAGTANASLLLRFNVNLSDGCFEIDSCCVKPASHVNYVDENQIGVSPGFTKGLITVGSGACLPPNVPPIAVCQNVQVAADDNCQGEVIPPMVNNGSNDAEDGINVTIELFPLGPFPLGPSPVKLIVTDTQGAKDTCDATITVVDNTPPVANCPGNIIVRTVLDVCTAIVNWIATVSDNCPGATIVCTPPSGSTFPKGQTTVTCTATDASGNTSQCAFTVTVNDTEPPLITCPTDITVGNDPDQCGAVVDFAVPAVDNCPGVTVEAMPPSGYLFLVGTTEVRCFATDQSGNRDTCYFLVTVMDEGDVSPWCGCPCPADPLCDGVRSDVIDVTLAVGRAFRGDAAILDPDCATERTDANCSGATDVLDVVAFVSAAFRGADLVAFCPIIPVPKNCHCKDATEWGSPRAASCNREGKEEYVPSNTDGTCEGTDPLCTSQPCHDYYKWVCAAGTWVPRGVYTDNCP